MKLSVVTISFNQARFLEACIQSILSQDYPNIEYIIVDAGSTDGSRNIIERYSEKISHIIFENDDGPADGLNKGFKYAKGDILCYLNSDDIFLPGALQTVFSYFSQLPHVDVLLGNGLQIDEQDKPVRKIFSTSWNLKRYAFGGCSSIQQSTFFRRDVFLKTTGFNVDNHTCWDGELLVDMALANAEFKNIPEQLGGFRLHKKSISGSGRLKQQHLLDKRRIFNKIMGRPPTIYDYILHLFHRAHKMLSNPNMTAYKIRRMVIFNGE